MKQILQNLRTGTVELAEVPCPATLRGEILIRTSRSLVSAGTERMLIEFAKANLIEKARQQPAKVCMVLDKVRSDGLGPALDSVRNKLDQPLALGYCNFGRVVDLGAGVTEFGIGDRVASNGKHAEMVSVPVNLCAKVPESVSDEAAAFTVIGSIALQGIRLTQPTLGEAMVVTGLGLIGLVTVQLLRAHGCRVLGLDFDRARLAFARQFGADVVDLSSGADPVQEAIRFARGNGVDGVIITASTKSSMPVHQAALMCRKRGRIVLVGVTGLELSRADFYEKELTFQVSCSYGPGRYDPRYEQKGLDYPIGFVRWTEQRNFEAILDMLAEGRLAVEPLISHRFGIDDAETAYEIVGGAEPSLGVLLAYPEASDMREEAVRSRSVRVAPRVPAATVCQCQRPFPTVGVIGSGNYATAVLIPAFRTAGARLKTVASNTGVSGVHAARKFGFEEATTDIDTLIADPAIEAVIIATRHDTHAELARMSLAAGKHVFVEKPLAISREEIDALQQSAAAKTAKEPGPILMVGFNRRFSPHVRRMKQLLAEHTGPKAFVMTVNAGAIPANHWTQDFAVGGGRIVGEACHFIDLIRFLAGVPIVAHRSLIMDAGTADTSSISLRFADGSIGTIHYLANGHKSFAKERLEVFAGGGILQLDNFRKLTGFGWPGLKTMSLWRQDKGQFACVRAFVDAISSGGAAPIPFEEIVEVSRLSIEVAGAEAP